MFDELARQSGMRDALKDAADRGAAVARATAPEYSGPTYDPAVQRKGEYKASIYSAASMRPNGWRAEFGATAPWTLQVEFGSGRPSTSRDRPQAGWSPKTRTLGRALESMRSA
ncbi:hypothetical protein ACGF3K_14585 [Streptomyces sp. NPDC047980]|uniref:hypothetical protein n=1 Tax=Streptomyces sp. NPDC047980 TaxID=3365494 RepID=UPI003721D49F